MAVTSAMKDMAMDLVATLAAEEIAKVQDCGRAEALEALLSSSIGEAIYDDALKLWWESPADIADAFLKRLRLSEI